MKAVVASRCGLGLVVLLGLFVIFPPSAQAQMSPYPCGVPGPGERVVGMTPAGNGIGSVGLCVNDYANARPSSPNYPEQAPQQSTYGAVAFHPEAADVWMQGGLPSKGMAEKLAVAACNQVMGGGCIGTGDWSNSSVVVVRSVGNNFRLVWLGEGQAELRATLAECAAQQLLPCERYATFDSSRPSYTPGRGVRKTYVAVAWSTATLNNKLYVASGLSSSIEARDQALSACRAANPSGQCDVPTNGSGFIQVGQSSPNGEASLFTVMENTPDRAEQAARVNCQRLKSANCVLQAMFDSRKREQFVYDFNTGKRE